jgi:multidrug resistance efflux pump
VTLRESGEIQKQLSKELLRYEQDVERLCLSPLNEIIETDIPTLTKARKALHKSTQESDGLRQKLNQAMKSAQQNPSQTQIKVDTLRRELDEANHRMIQLRVRSNTSLSLSLGSNQY